MPVSSDAAPADVAPLGVAVCGLGLLGQAVAVRLLDRGVPVTVWNRTPRSIPGAKVARTPAAAATGVPVVITVLSDATAIDDVVFAADGIAAGAPEILVQMSTVDPEYLLALRDRLPASVGLLDAPVLGSGAQAAVGSLRVLVGGNAAVLDRCRPVLAPLGETVHVGPLSAGSALKQVVNAAVAPMVALLAEAVALADVLGLDPGLVLDELERSRIGPLVRRKRMMIESSRYPPAAKLETFRKDMELVERAGASQGLAMTMVAAARHRAEAACATGLGTLDYSVLVAQARGASVELEAARGRPADHGLSDRPGGVGGAGE